MRSTGLFYLIFSSLILFYAGCVSARRVVPEVEIVKDLPKVSTQKSAKKPDLEAPPLKTFQQKKVTIDAIIQESKTLSNQCEEFFFEGKIEDGRACFLRAIEVLDNSSFDFFSCTEIEQAYYTLISQMERYELRTLFNPSELQVLHFKVVPFPPNKIEEPNLYMIRVDPEVADSVNQDMLDMYFDIPVVVNKSVLRNFNYYQNKGRKVMEIGLLRSGRYIAIFREIFQKEGVPLDLIYLAHVESLFKPHAYSRAKAKGIWQFIRPTGRRYGLKVDWWIDERSDLIKSTQAAARYLKDLHVLFQDWYLALAAYNSGEQRIKRILRRYGPIDFWEMSKRRLLPRETRNYVPSILAAAIIFRRPELYGFRIKPEEKLEFEMVALKEQVDLRVVSELIDVQMAVLKGLNPELRRDITPFDHNDYQLKVPLGRGTLLQRKLASLPPEEKVQFRHYQVKHGDTLSLIASRYSASMQSIAQVNRIRNIHRLRVSQVLIIPSSGYPSHDGAKISRNLPGAHIVRKGDSLSKIAQLYRVSIRDLLRWNSLQVTQVIYPGQKIKILQYRN